MNRRFVMVIRLLGQDAEGQWHLANTIDMGDFINPYMDETFNPSFFGLLKWRKIKPMLKNIVKEK